MMKKIFFVPETAQEFNTFLGTWLAINFVGCLVSIAIAMAASSSGEVTVWLLLAASMAGLFASFVFLLSLVATFIVVLEIVGKIRMR